MTTAQPPHQSKAKLLDAAVRVIRTKGYIATTVDDLCHAAGVTKGSFFHHFDSKEQLAIAVWGLTPGSLRMAAAPPALRLKLGDAILRGLQRLLLHQHGLGEQIRRSLAVGRLSWRSAVPLPGSRGWAVERPQPFEQVGDRVGLPAPA